MKAAPNDAEMLQEFVRVTPSAGGLLIEVRVIEWPEHHRPGERWLTAKRLPTATPPSKVEQAKVQVLNSHRWFFVCPLCGLRMPLGWQLAGYCQGCAGGQGIVS